MLSYGKGGATAPVALNFGDLFAYAFASSRVCRCFKSDDFTRTDVRPLS